MKATFLILISLFTFSAFAQVHTSKMSCHAQVNCYARDNWGRPYILTQAKCGVYGSTYVYGNGNSQNKCMWEAIDGVGVHCEGYSNVNGFWQWQVYHVPCPGVRY